jgi:hypothetical protein
VSSEKIYNLYWIRHLEHTDYNTQGYIGITSDLGGRFKAHKRKAPNPHFRHAIELYGWDSLVKEILATGLDREGVDLLELLLRPTERLGWNVNKGGEAVPTNKGLKMSDAICLHGSVIKQGILNPANKLSPDDVKEIYRRILRGDSSVGIARDYSVADTTIAKIKYLRKKYYRDVLSTILEDNNDNL